MTATKTSSSVLIEASPSAVWNRVGSIENMGTFSPETMTTEWLDGATEARQGARFRGHNHNGHYQWTVDCEVLEYTPEKRFQFGVGSSEDGFNAIWTYELEARGDATVLTESVDAPVLLDPESTPGKNPHRLEELNGLIKATLAYVKTDTEGKS